MAYIPAVDLLPPTIVHINSFGQLINDGVTDNNAVFTAALNYAKLQPQGATKVIVPEGVYATSGRYDCRDLNNFSIEGQGRLTTTIKAIGSSNAPLFIWGRNTSTIQVSGGGPSHIRLDGNGISNICLQILGLSHFRLEDIWLTSPLLSALDMQSTGSATTGQVQDFVIERLFIDCQYGTRVGWSGLPATLTAHGITLNDNDYGFKFPNAIHDFVIDQHEVYILNGDAVRCGYLAIGTLRQGHYDRAAASETKQVTISIANPAVITGVPSNVMVGDPIQFATTGSLPTGVDTTDTYYLLAGGQFSLTQGGSPVVTTGTQSGNQTLLPQSYGRGLVLMDTTDIAQFHGAGLNNSCEHMTFDQIQVSVPGLFVLASYVDNPSFPFQATPKWNTIKPFNTGNGSAAIPISIVSDRTAIPIPTYVHTYIDDVPVVIETDDGVNYGKVLASPISVACNYASQVQALVSGRSARTTMIQSDIESGTGGSYSESVPVHIFDSGTGGTKQPHLLLTDDGLAGNYCTVFTDQVSGNLNMIPTTGIPVVLQVTGTALGPDGNVELTVNSTVGLNLASNIYVFGIGGTTEANNASPVNTQGNPTGGVPQTVGLIIDSTHFTINNTPYVHTYTPGSGGLVIIGNAIVLPVTGVSANGSGHIRLTVPTTAFLEAGSAGRVTTNGIGEGTGGSSVTSADFVNASITIVNSTTVDVPISSYNVAGGYNTTGYLVSPIVGAVPSVQASGQISAPSYSTPVSFAASASNNGSGLIRITLPVNGNAQGLQNGSIVEVNAINGVPNATGVWPITNLDLTNFKFFDLVGSIFSGSQTAAGTASWSQPLIGPTAIQVIPAVAPVAPTTTGGWTIYSDSGNSDQLRAINSAGSVTQLAPNGSNINILQSGTLNSAGVSSTITFNASVLAANYIQIYVHNFQTNTGNETLGLRLNVSGSDITSSTYDYSSIATIGGVTTATVSQATGATSWQLATGIPNSGLNSSFFEIDFILGSAQFTYHGGFANSGVQYQLTINGGGANLTERGSSFTGLTLFVGSGTISSGAYYITGF